MIMAQITCDVCDERAPLKEILVGEEIQLLCEQCWEKMLNEAGDEDDGIRQGD